LDDNRIRRNNDSDGLARALAGPPSAWGALAERRGRREARQDDGKHQRGPAGV